MADLSKAEFKLPGAYAKLDEPPSIAKRRSRVERCPTCKGRRRLVEWGRHLTCHTCGGAGEVLPYGRSFFQGRGPEDLGGRQSVMPIDDVVRWARTGRGGRQFQLFDELAGSACVWGLCS